VGAPAPAEADAAAAQAASEMGAQPVAGGSSAFPEPIEPRYDREEAAQHFIPPAPEQAGVRVTRMPQVEDLPQVAQNQLRAMRDAQGAVSTPPPETRRRSLLEKLAAFGITRADEEPAAKAAAHLLPLPPPLRPHSAPPAQSDFGRPQRQQAPRAPVGVLDPHGRPAARPPAPDDEHLDIPAFLRRQSN
jgi:cell division protein FtsZ